MNKQISNNKKSAFQLIMMIFLSVLAQAVALYKSRFTATSFGATNLMDAYNYSVSIATFVFSFVTTGITTVIIPAYVNQKDNRAINTFISVVFSCALAIIGIILIFRFQLIDLLTTKEYSFVSTAANFLFISFLINGITAFVSVTAAYYQCINHYIIPKMVVLISNICVAGVLMTGIIREIHLYLGLLIIGSALNLIVDLAIAIKLGFRFFPQFDLKNQEFKSMLAIFTPTLFSSGVYRIQTMVDTIISGNLGEGQLTILTYVTQVINMVNNMVIGNLTVYVYPKIVKRLKEIDHKLYFWNYAILFHAIVVLIIACFFTVGQECLSLIFLGGKFTEGNLRVMYYGVCIYIFGQQTNIVRDLIYRYFYANGDTKTTVYNSIIVSFCNITSSLILVRFLGIYGVILGTVLASFISLCMITIRFDHKFGLGVPFHYIIKELGKDFFALAISTAVVLLSRTVLNFDNRIMTIVFYGCMTAVIYLAVLWILDSSVKRVKL